MTEFISYTIIGIFTGAAYAIAASGLVLTYSTTRVFNIAHGAVGMVFAFVYWDFSIRQDIPVWLSLVLVLFVAAPLFGVFVQRVLARGLGSAPVSVSLVVTVGLLVALIGVATQIWPPESRTLPQFFKGRMIEVGDITVTWHQVITVIISIIVAMGLYVLLARTRIGTGMRASVDNPELLQLYGGRPQLVAALAWAIGCSLAALAGILLAPVIGLQYYDLTLLVISAYAAAMLGKLTNLPMTYIGAMALGIGQSYVVGYLDKIPFHKEVPGLAAVIPTLFLFAILVLLPQAPLRIGQVKGIVSAPVPTLGRAAAWGAALIVGVMVLSVVLSGSNLLLVGTAATYAIVMLSLVLLTGYGGYVSLAQFTFAGVGAVAYAKIDQPNLLGLFIAVLVAAAVGALVAIPVLRLTGLYLALATLAFAQLMDKLLFQSAIAFEFNNPLKAERLSILGLNLDGTGRYAVMMTVFFVLIALVVLAVRRGRLGRILVAVRDSPAGAGTLGVDMRWLRVGLFAASAGIAGFAGALFAGLRGTIVAFDFQFFASLLLLLMAVVWGVTSVTGAALGGIFLMYLPVAQSDSPSIAGLLFLLLGLGAVILARDPNGLANKLFQIPGKFQDDVYPWLVKRFPALARSRYVDDDEFDDELLESQKEVDPDVVASR
ncbi:branched-chain amino acid transport system permease protein [Aeromicrobium panaciterrae]|uniref:Branched-chain amino acid transport system permease protein n=1 Tax=Aeromicrobium panaciterrae TaxID=363861 RepID=A0ABU1UJH4_9ACTN|nr:ABC transporter permease [Aeromicrobium panaciterrae]MDR7085322.1 branched-chain amino acid transport system permease protein [Aeromicrobium panaciterrae]